MISFIIIIYKSTSSLFFFFLVFFFFLSRSFSIVSTFDEGNLTDNETGYLKFLIMYYLNNYGNCTNVTWEEYLEFYKCTALGCGCSVFGAISASGSAPDAMAGDVPGNSYGNGINRARGMGTLRSKGPRALAPIWSTTKSTAISVA